MTVYLGEYFDPRASSTLMSGHPVAVNLLRVRRTLESEGVPQDVPSSHNDPGWRASEEP
jgi:hypothetical protein